MKTNLLTKIPKVVFLFALLLMSSKALATTYYLKNANVTTANNFTSWNTDPTGGGAGTNATTFANAADVWVILNAQNAIFANNTATTIAGILQVDGTLQIANNPGNGVDTTLTITGTIQLNRASGNQVTLSNGAGNGNTAFVLGASGILRTANTAGIFGASCSIAPIGNKSSVTLPITATYEFNGSSNQSTTGLPSTINNLIINNTGGTNTTNLVSLVQSTVITSTLIITTGNFNLGNFNVTTGDISIASPSASKMIIISGTGELRKRFTTNATFTFPVGDNTSTTEYSPITLTVTGASYTNAYLGVRVTNLKHPSNASTTHYLNRYWSVTQSGVGTCVASTSAGYNAADISGTETSIASARFQGTFNRTTNPWEKYGALGSNTLIATSETITAGQTTIFTGITNATPTVTILGGDVTVCQNAITPLTASPAGDAPFSYTWTGLISGSNTTASITANTSSPGGPNSYTVTVLDGNGISGTSIASTVTVTAGYTPTVSLVSDDVDNTFCEGDSVTFTATAENISGGTVTYDFIVAGNSVQTGISDTYTTTDLTNGQAVLVDISVSGGVCLTTNNASSNSISNTVTTQSQWYLDADSDGYYTGSAVSSCTSPGAGYTTTVLGDGDCNDDPLAVNPLNVPSSAINPGATEVCYNNIDDNCDGFLSEGCAPVVVNMTPATTITNFAIALSAVPYTYPGASTLGYRFWIRNLTSGEIREVDMATRFVTIPSDIRSYNTLYELRAGAIINGEVVPYAGNTITVISPSVQLIQLSTTSCNTTLSYIGSTISATPGPNAVNYTFRIRLASDNSPTPTYGTVTTGSRFVNSNSFIGMPLQYNTVYSVSVKYSYNNNDGLGIQETIYGAECTLTTPNIPVIGLSNPICGSTLASMNSTISANPATYAIQYRFRMRLTSSNPNLPESYSTSLPVNSRFTSIAALQQQFQLQYATSYSISVQYSLINNNVEQWSNYGPECILFTPEAPNKLRTVEVPLEARAFPNPFTNNFLIDVNTSSKSSVNIKVYDMVGRLIDQQEANGNDLETLQLGNQYPNGIYNLIITQENKVKTVRVVKR